jgi:hypothetical protein
MFPVFLSMVIAKQRSTLKETKFQATIQHFLANPVFLIYWTRVWFSEPFILVQIKLNSPEI